MVNVDTVYQRVLVLSNKEQRGYITPQEFNLLANQAQMDIFEQYFYDLNQFRRLNGNDTGHADVVNILEEKIGIFEDFQAVERFDTDPPNEVFAYNLTQAIPDLYRISNVRVFREQSNGTAGWRIVEKISRKERFENQLGPLTRATALRPTYTLDQPGQDLLVRFQNDGDPTITVDYIRRPRRANWTFTVVNGTALSNPGAADYQNFELHASEETDLVFKILTLAGVTIKDPNLYQIGASEDMKDVQQEKQ